MRVGPEVGRLQHRQLAAPQAIGIAHLEGDRVPQSRQLPLGTGSVFTVHQIIGRVKECLQLRRGSVRAYRSPGQGGEPPGEGRSGHQPRMSFARAGHALVDPAGHLDERAQADDGLVPAQLAGLDRHRRPTLVIADKPAGQHPAEHPDERPLPARHAQRRLAGAGPGG